MSAGFVSVPEMVSQRFLRLFHIVAGAVTDTEEVFHLEGRLERFAHFCALVIRQFIHHRCLERASALSYSSLLALIPFLVVALSLTTSLLNPQDEARLVGFVVDAVSSVAPPANVPAMVQSASRTTTNSNFSAVSDAAGNEAGDTNVLAAELASHPPPVVSPPETVNTQKAVALEIHDLVRKASNGTLGSLGLIFLVLTAVSLLRGIEETFNDIWGVTRHRNWRLQFMLYWCILTAWPLLLAPALGLAYSSRLQSMRSVFESSPILAPLATHVLPILLLSLALGLFYKLTPNTTVEWRAAAIGGLCAGVTWHGYNQLGFVLVSRAMSASKFYGGVFLIVLLMGGLYILWLVLLSGAQIAYAWQNRTAYLQDRLADNVNQRGREFVALRIMTCLGRRFQNGLPPATVPEISTELGVPSRLTASILCTLAVTRLVTEVAGAEAAFNPARPLEAINAHDILLAMRTGTGQELPLSELPELAEIYGEFARIEQAERNAAAGVTLLALAHRGVPRAALEPPALRNPESHPIVVPVPEKNFAPRPIELPMSEPAPEIGSAPEPVAKPASPRRETARPEEAGDFPL